MKIMLNQRSAGKGVISNAVAMDDWIDQRKRTEEQNEKDSPIAGWSTLVGGRTRGTAPGYRRRVRAGCSRRARPISCLSQFGQRHAQTNVNLILRSMLPEGRLP